MEPRRWWLHGAGALLTVAFAALAWRSGQPGPLPITWYLPAMGVAWLALAMGWRAQRGATATATVAIVAWALAARAAGFACAPLYEDDWARYLWDGWQVAGGHDPYATAPAEHFADRGLPPAIAVALDTVNHPDWPTIYGPLCQVLFAGAALIAPGALWAWKLLLAGIEIAALLVLRRRLPAPALLLYAWCPLLIQETWCSAHPDAVAMALLVAAWVLRARWALAGIAIGLALAARLHAAPVALVLIAARFGGNRGHAADATALLAQPAATGDGWRCALVAGATLALAYAPFLAIGDAGLAVTGRFAQAWDYNGLAHGLLALGLGDGVARVVCTLALVALLTWCAWSARRSADAWPAGLAQAGALALSPVVNPWYLVPALPWIAARPQAWTIVFALVLPLSYVHGLSLGDATLGSYQHPGWVRPLETAAVALALGWDCWRRCRMPRGRGDVPPFSGSGDAPPGSSSAQ